MIKYSDYDNYGNPQTASKIDDETGRLLGTFRNSYGTWIQIKNPKTKFKLSGKTKLKFNPPESDIIQKLNRSVNNGTRKIEDFENRDSL